MSKKSAATVKEGETYAVEDIVDTRKVAGVHQYKVAWMGCPESENSWEPHGNLLDCHGIVVKFLTKKAGAEANKRANNAEKRALMAELEARNAKARASAAEERIRQLEAQLAEAEGRPLRVSARQRASGNRRHRGAPANGQRRHPHHAADGNDIPRFDPAPLEPYQDVMYGFGQPPAYEQYVPAQALYQGHQEVIWEGGQFNEQPEGRELTLQEL